MKLKITRRSVLKDIPSVSGIEVIENFIYLIGDNSPWLFKLNKNFVLVDKFQIYPLKEITNEIIEKKFKPDFEAMTSIPENSAFNFYIFGSGSKSPLRDILVKINTTDPNNYVLHSLISFYSKLKQECHLTDNEFNIEAAVATTEFLVLFNRGKNLIIKFSLLEFNAFLMDESTNISFSCHVVQLPKIGEIESGFSGAVYSPQLNKIVFTSSVENTPNWFDDGEVLGSFIGIVELENLTTSTKPECTAILENGENPTLKIESVAILSYENNKMTLLMASDSDGGDSELLEAVLEF